MSIKQSLERLDPGLAQVVPRFRLDYNLELRKIPERKKVKTPDFGVYFQDRPVAYAELKALVASEDYTGKSSYTRLENGWESCIDYAALSVADHMRKAKQQLNGKAIIEGSLPRMVIFMNQRLNRNSLDMVEVLDGGLVYSSPEGGGFFNAPHHEKTKDIWEDPAQFADICVWVDDGSLRESDVDVVTLSDKGESFYRKFLASNSRQLFLTGLCKQYKNEA